MYFHNACTRAVTTKDEEYLRQVCILLRAMYYMGASKRKTNPNWRLSTVNCHSIARMVSLVFKELTLVDGFIVGLQVIPGQTQVTVVHTHHSWLRTPDGAIIDPYPMGIIAMTSALLLPTTGTMYCVHGGNLYHERAEVRDHFDVPQSRRNARAYLRPLKKFVRQDFITMVIKSLH